jgi:hypothetical protein
MKQRGFRYCSTCSNKLQKRGMTAAGTQRWYCTKCAKSSCRARPDLARKLLLERFIKWLIGKESQAELAERHLKYTERTWRNKTAWCWSIVPSRRSSTLPEHPGIILMDGTWTAGPVCLIARTLGGVLSWRFAPWECSSEWKRLIFDLPVPEVVVVDGQKGILRAIASCWPNARIQRCHFHVWMNMRSKLTLHPKSIAGHELLSLARTLLKGIHTLEHRDEWLHELHAFGVRYEKLLKERTYAYGELNPATGYRKWWYTHRGLRSAYRQLIKLVEDRQLFTYLEVVVTDTNTGKPVLIPRTTNHVEGGINSRLRDLMRLHRGLIVDHQIRQIDWYLHTRKTKQN